MFVYQKFKILIRISLLGTGINLFWYDFFILIGCLLQNHDTSGVSKTLRSFLYLLSLILQYYSIQKLKLVPFLFLMFTFHVHSFVHSSFFSFSQSLQLYTTDPILYYGCLTQFFKSMVQMFVIFFFFFSEVIATTLTLGNRNHIFLIHHLPANHD